MRRTILKVLLALCAIAGAAFPGTASALVVEAPTYSGTTIKGDDAIETPPSENAPALGSGFDLEKVAIDQTSGALYVAANQRIYKFDTATKASAPFSALGGRTVLPNQPVYEAGDLEVDNSATPTQGRIYDFAEQNPIFSFLPSGEQAPFKTPTGQFCGASVAPTGNLWLTKYHTEIAEFRASGEPTGSALFVNAFDTPAENACEMEIDAQGNFYVTTQAYGYGAFVRKYDPSGQYEYTIGNGSAYAIEVDLANGNVYVDDQSSIELYSSAGTLLATFGQAEVPYEGLQESHGVAVDSSTKEVYVTNKKFGAPGVDVFTPGSPVVAPDVSTDAAVPASTTAVLNGTVDPDGISTQDCHFEWGDGPAGPFASYPNVIECDLGSQLEGSDPLAVSASISGLSKGTTYHFRVVAENVDGVKLSGVAREFRAQGTPIVVGEFVNKIKGDVARLNAEIDPDQGDTIYRFEYGTDAGYGTTIPVPSRPIKQISGVQTVGETISGLAIDTEYHYRVVATNNAGTTFGPDQTFRTFPPFTNVDPCPNALARQQTGAILLDHCRAFELVSAANTGGYNVESSVVPGQQPLPAFPDADGRVLYGVHNGGIPGTGSPTNKAVDPYLARRDDSGWSTTYVGIPADATPSNAPFASTFLAADRDLSTFAFWGPQICSPCFDDGSSGIPLRLPDGNLVQGMVGSMPQTLAEPMGYVAKPISDDGSHFVFGTDRKLESAGREGAVSIYDRELGAGGTQVVSTLPDGTTMEGEVGELDISSDGSRIVVAEGVSTDEAGNRLWHPYMHIGADSHSLDLAPGSTNGVLYAGMSSNGREVYYTTTDSLLAADGDASGDLYVAEVGAGGGPVTLKLLTNSSSDACDPSPNSEGNNWNAVGGSSPDLCGVVAIGGSGGVAPFGGTVYFLSPEKLDGTGALDEPNLFVSEAGGPPERLTTLEPGDPLVRASVVDSEARRLDLFQTNSDGDFAVFAVTAPLTGFDNHGKLEIFRFSDAGGDLDCVSCPSSRARPSGDAYLSAQGLSISDDGRVFFTTAEPLVLRDTGERADAYEWTEGDARLISSGTSPFDAALLSVTRDGRDAFFFSRDTLVREDGNGTLMKIYDAREGGGFFFIPEPPPCAASDECHGPGSPTPPTPTIGSFAGSDGNAKPVKCKKGFVKKHGKCKRKKHRKPRK